MPLINVKLIEGVFNEAQREYIAGGPRQEDEAGIATADLPFDDANPFGPYAAGMTGKHTLDRTRRKD